MSSSFACSAVYISGETSGSVRFCSCLPVEDTLLILTQVSRFPKMPRRKMAQTLSCILHEKVPAQGISPPSFHPPSFLHLVQQKVLSTYCVPGIESVNDMILQLHLITETDLHPDNQNTIKENVCLFSAGSSLLLASFL